MSAELDAEVAEKVMGWTDRVADYTAHHDIVLNRGTEKQMRIRIGPRKDESDTAFRRFAPSSDPVACSLVKARLREAGVEWLVHDHLSTGHKRGDRRWVNVKQTMSGPNRRGRDEFEGVVRGAPTEEEAIARFALACLAGDTKGRPQA